MCSTFNAFSFIFLYILATGCPKANFRPLAKGEPRSPDIHHDNVTDSTGRPPGASQRVSSENWSSAQCGLNRKLSDSRVGL